MAVANTENYRIRIQITKNAGHASPVSELDSKLIFLTLRREDQDDGKGPAQDNFRLEGVGTVTAMGHTLGFDALQ